MEGREPKNRQMDEAVGKAQLLKREKDENIFLLK